MQNAAQPFRYTAQRSSYLTLVMTFIFLIIVEGGGTVLLTALFVALFWLKLTLLVGFTGLYCCIFMLLLFPLWTKHRLTATHLHLHYGFTFNVSISRDEISNVEVVLKSPYRIQPLRVRYIAKKQRMIACFSEQELVLLTFKQPVVLRTGWRLRPTKSILLNVDQRREFLGALLATIPAVVDAAASEQRAGVDDDSGHADLPLSQQLDNAVPAFSSQPAPSVATAPVAIRIEGLTRRFAHATAVDALNMTIRQGEIYGFLGSNGAGKSTTIKMLVGLLQPSAGHAWIAEHDVWAEPLVVKKMLGYVADHALLYERLTGREFLDFLAQVRGLPKTIADEQIVSLMTLLELTEHADRLCGAYSFGMKRKLSLAGALLHRPEILILDEPLNGLDPRSARRIKDLFRELAAQGTSIVLSTHDLAIAETVCHRVGIFHKGHLLAEGSSAELRQLAAAPDLETVFLNLTSEQEQPEEVLS